VRFTKPPLSVEQQVDLLLVNHRVRAVLMVCAHPLALLAPNSHWQRRLRNLLNQHPKVPIKNMGFPGNCLDCPIWKGAADAG